MSRPPSSLLGEMLVEPVGQDVGVLAEFEPAVGGSFFDDVVHDLIAGVVGNPKSVQNSPSTF